MILALTILCLNSVAAELPTRPPPAAVAGHQLQRADGLLVRWDSERSWGSTALVKTIEAVGARLAFILPEADPLAIGDLSNRGGGYMWGHKTHDMGVDADIGLFYDEGLQSLGGFADIDPKRLDVARTWILISELLATGRVQFILLDQGHIDVLRAHLVDDLGLPPETVDPIFPVAQKRIPWDQRGAIRHAPNHRSHLHVRVSNRPEDT